MLQGLLVFLRRSIGNIVVAADAHVQAFGDGFFYGRKCKTVEILNLNTQDRELYHGFAQLFVAVLLRIGVQGNGRKRLACQDFPDEVAQDVARTEFDKHAATGSVDVFNFLLEQHRFQHVVRQGCFHCSDACGVSDAGGVGKNHF